MKKRIIICAAALVLAAAAVLGVGKAYAYFTTYVQADVSRTIHLGDITTIDEKYADWEKTVTITNSAESAKAVWVRVRAFAGSAYKLDYAGSGWSQDGDWWYYGEPLQPGGEAESIVVSILDAETGEKPAADGADFNVVVVYETTPAVENGTDASGNTQYLDADWEMTAGGEEDE